MKYVAYYRVSTKKQGESQLGLKAQKQSVERFISPDLIDKEYTEVETGTNKKHRPILEKAINLCKLTGATLIIAKLDRLARNVSFVSALMDSGVKFKAVDMPEANELTINIMASIAQHEAKVISTRIKEALAQSDKKLGTPENLTNEARQKGLNKILESRRNNENNVRAFAFIKSLNYSNMKLVEIAEELNTNKFKTARGKDFTATQVSRMIKAIDRIDKINKEQKEVSDKHHENSCIITLRDTVYPTEAIEITNSKKLIDTSVKLDRYMFDVKINNSISRAVEFWNTPNKEHAIELGEIMF